MSEFDQDLDYLRAELAQAQQWGHTTTQIRTTELQRLLDKFRVLSLRPVSPVKITGYARSSELQMMHKGKLMTMRVRRIPNEWCSQPIYVDPGKPGGDMTATATFSQKDGKLTLERIEHSEPETSHE